MTMRLVADLETDGLLNEVSKIHSLVAYDIDTDTLYSYHGKDIDKGIKLLEDADLVVFHNGIKYDYPVLKKLYPSFSLCKTKVHDTMVLTHLIWPTIKDTDYKRAEVGSLPKNLIGSYSLAAWGYRIGNYKGEYKQGWETWTPEMQAYCEQDVMVTVELYRRCLEKNYSPEAIELEHGVAWVMAQQERNGFYFNQEAAINFYAELVKEREAIAKQLQEVFPPWKVEVPFVPKSNNKTKGYIKGETFMKKKTMVFNPGSRPQVAERLMTIRGWKPKEFTEKGQPQVDETILSKLPYPEAQVLSRYFLIEKRLGQLADGNQAWLKHVREGKIHGSVNTNAAVTGRATHAYPNISQVPSCTAPYGPQCRALFTVPHGWRLVGADASGLELRCLAHFMAKYDEGKYGEVLLTGDVHWQNVISMGLTNEDRDKHSKLHTALRDGAKTFIYGFLYGAGDEKVGRIVYDIVLSLRATGLPYEDIAKAFFGDKPNPGPKLLKQAGKKLKNTFLEKTPALRHLKDKVAEIAEHKGYIVGLDGRRVHIRSPHAALNTLLQSAGALVCKKWLVMLEDGLQARGYKHGWDGDYCFCAWVHDEVQIACKAELADTIGKIAEECAVRVGEHFKFRCPLAGEYKVGNTWAETH